MTITLFLIIIICLLAIVWILLSICDCPGPTPYVSYTLGFLLATLFFCEYKKDVPQAIDVYRNKTTLEIKYKVVDNDTIATDRTVIFKEE